MRDVVEETRDEVSSHSQYEAFLFTSRFTRQCEIDEIANKFCIPDPPFLCYLPSKTDRAYNATQDLCVFRDVLKGGLRFPLHPFIPEILGSYKIHPTQIHPNGWHLITCFMVRCKQLGVEPNVRIFRQMFNIKNHVQKHAS